jgi:Fe2+ transport system protein FeoA
VNATTENGRPIFPLSSISPGQRVRVHEVRGGSGLGHRLASMGIFAGSELLLVRGGSRGPIIIQVGESRYVLGRGMGHKILVERL